MRCVKPAAIATSWALSLPRNCVNVLPSAEGMAPTVSTKRAVCSIPTRRVEGSSRPYSV